MHESFLSQNIFRDSKKIFSDFSKINKYEDHFVIFIDQASSVKMAKRERGQYPAILTELAWSSTEKEASYIKSDNAFQFSRFLVPSRQRNHRTFF